MVRLAPVFIRDPRGAGAPHSGFWFCCVLLYLAVSGLGCSTRGLRCLTWDLSLQCVNTPVGALGRSGDGLSCSLVVES